MAEESNTANAGTNIVGPGTSAGVVDNQGVKADPVDDKADADLVDHEVTQEDLDLNPEFVKEGIKVGEIIRIPKDLAEELNTEEDDKNAADAAAVIAEVDKDLAQQVAASAGEVKMYESKVVVSDGFRTVNDRQIRHIRLEDGSGYDLSEEDYQNKVIVQL